MAIIELDDWYSATVAKRKLGAIVQRLNEQGGSIGVGGINDAPRFYLRDVDEISLDGSEEHMGIDQVRTFWSETLDRVSKTGERVVVDGSRRPRAVLYRNEDLAKERSRARRRAARATQDSLNQLVRRLELATSRIEDNSASNPAMPANLYDGDIILWAEQQADVLRELGNARQDLPDELDLENVIEEIENVGREQLHAVESLLRLILAHLVKLGLERQSDAAPHWRGEIENWHADLCNRFTPSMVQRLDLNKTWRRAKRQVVTSSVTPKGNTLGEACPFGLEQLVVETLDVEGLVAKLIDSEPTA